MNPTCFDCFFCRASMDGKSSAVAARTDTATRGAGSGRKVVEGEREHGEGE